MRARRPRRRTATSPTACPCAQRNGKHIAPPIITTSAKSRKRSITAILSATFAPPIIATSGRAGCSRISVSVRTSRSSSLPAALGSRCVMPSVLACARCAAPNASFTYSVRQLGQRARQRWIVGRLARLEAHVLQHQHVALLQLLGERLNLLAYHRRGKRDLRVGQLAQTRHDRRQRQVLLAPALRPAQVREQYDARAARAQLFDRRPAPPRYACRRPRADPPSAFLPSGTLKSTRTRIRLPSTSRRSRLLIGTPFRSARAPSRYPPP